MISSFGESQGVEQAGSTRLLNFLTLAAVLLRAQNRRVVAQLVINAANDLCPGLVFSVLYQPDPAEAVATVQLGGILLAPGETERMMERLATILPQSGDQNNFKPDQPAPPEIAVEFAVQRLYYAPAQTPTYFYGWLIAGVPYSLTEEEQYYFRSLAQLAAIALENAARFEALKESAAETTLVNEVASALATSLNAEELFHTFMTYLRNMLMIERSALAILSPDWSQYDLAYSWNDPPGRVRRGYLRNLPLADSLIEQSIRQREILIDPRFETDNSFFKVIDGSRLIVPLLAKGQPIGAIELAARPGNCYREDDPRLSLVEKLARLFALALVNSRLYEEKQISAEFDSRVGVYNHDYFDRELMVQVEKARRLGYKLGLIMLDMDNLKRVNDQYGHLAGDAALRHIASRVSDTVRATDVVARYGGDEFMVMLPGCTARSLEIVSEKARRNISNSSLMLENGTSVQLTVSIGAVLFPDDAETALELVQQVDSAVFVAKKQRDEVRIGRKARTVKVSERELERGMPENRPSEPAELDQQSLDIDSLSEGQWVAGDYEHFLNWLGGDRPGVAAKVLRETYNQLAETRQQLQEFKIRLANFEENAQSGVHLMAAIVERREAYLAGGTEKLQKLCHLLAKELELTAKQAEQLEVAVYLANLGHLVVPEAIWTKAGSLSAEEWQLVQQVPLEGAQMAQQFKEPISLEVERAIKHQRERFDGLGYPNGLAGEEIPLLARLLGLVGAVVAMSQPRSFRPSKSFELIRTELEQAAGRQFDPHLTQKILQLLEKGQLDFLQS